jgi:hypothetical protein
MKLSALLVICIIGIWFLVPTSSFLIAPWIFDYKIEYELNGKLDPNHIDPNESVDIRIKKLLDSIEWEGPKGRVILGYTLPVNIYDLYSKANAEWVFDEKKLSMYFRIIKSVNRPVVLNLRANHFFGSSEFSDWLASDNESLARTNHGQKIIESYFESKVVFPTFSLNPEIRINKYRFQGLLSAAKLIAEFEKENPRLIAAVTIAGEIHHVTPKLADPAASGNYENIEITDYSANSIKEFQSYLKTQFVSLDEMNSQLGTGFSEWSEVVPPKSDLRLAVVEPKSLHFDSYADGYLPVSGWLQFEETDSVVIYLNGSLLGKANMHLDRLDVYEALPDAKDSNLGFYYPLEYKTLAEGRHQIQIILERNKKKYLLGERQVLVCQKKKPNPFSGCEQDVSSIENKKHELKFPVVEGDGIRFNLDHPKNNLTLFYNPFAAKWQSYRAKQVADLIAEFTKYAKMSDLPPEKLFTQGIATSLEGSWNQIIYAISNKVLINTEVNPGLSLYGGKSFSSALKQLKIPKGYGVTELHPRLGKSISKDGFARAIAIHKEAGARFISPYYFFIQRGEAPTSNSVSDLYISSENKSFGSNYFYQAITEAVKD